MEPGVNKVDDQTLVPDIQRSAFNRKRAIALSKESVLKESTDLMVIADGFKDFVPINPENLMIGQSFHV